MEKQHFSVNQFFTKEVINREMNDYTKFLFEKSIEIILLKIHWLRDVTKVVCIVSTVFLP